MQVRPEPIDLVYEMSAAAVRDGPRPSPRAPRSRVTADGISRESGAPCWENKKEVPISPVNHQPKTTTFATFYYYPLRLASRIFLGAIPFANLVSLFLFISGKEHRALHDSIASAIVLHDPNKVLRPVPQVPAG
jgi:hypothetical protein